MTTSSFQIQKDNAYDNLVVRKNLVTNHRFVSRTVDSNVVTAALLDVDSIVTSGIVNEGDMVINGDLDISGQVMAKTIAVDDQGGDGAIWVIQEDPAATNNLLFQYNGTTSANVTPTGALTVSSLISTSSITGGLLQFGTNTTSQGYSVFVSTTNGLTLTFDNADNVPGRVILVLSGGPFNTTIAGNISVNGSATSTGFIVIGRGGGDSFIAHSLT